MRFLAIFLGTVVAAIKGMITARASLLKAMFFVNLFLTCQPIFGQVKCIDLFAADKPPRRVFDNTFYTSGEIDPIAHEYFEKQGLKHDGSVTLPKNEFLTVDYEDHSVKFGVLAISEQNTNMRSLFKNLKRRSRNNNENEVGALIFELDDGTTQTTVFTTKTGTEVAINGKMIQKIVEEIRPAKVVHVISIHIHLDPLNAQLAGKGYSFLPNEVDYNSLDFIAMLVNLMGGTKCKVTGVILPLSQANDALFFLYSSKGLIKK